MPAITAIEKGRQGVIPLLFNLHINSLNFLKKTFLVILYITGVIETINENKTKLISIALGLYEN
tara:strand:+ start:691 stop:882 length:192 start_codon:yes stop_codon:yes gene_type:complete